MMLLRVVNESIYVKHLEQWYRVFVKYVHKSFLGWRQNSYPYLTDEKTETLKEETPCPRPAGRNTWIQCCHNHSISQISERGSGGPWLVAVSSMFLKGREPYRFHVWGAGPVTKQSLAARLAPGLVLRSAPVCYLKWSVGAFLGAKAGTVHRGICSLCLLEKGQKF